MNAIYEAHLVPTHPNTAHAFPLRWDGEKFREGHGFDAELFQTREDAQAILDRHAEGASGLTPTVVEIEIDE